MIDLFVGRAVTRLSPGAGGPKFKSRAVQIEHSVANSLPPLPHFFERCCVAWAKRYGDGPRQLVQRFGAIQRVQQKI